MPLLIFTIKLDCLHVGDWFYYDEHNYKVEDICGGVLAKIHS